MAIAADADADALSSPPFSYHLYHRLLNGSRRSGPSRLPQFARLHAGKKQVETPCEPAKSDGSLDWEPFATPHEGEPLLAKPSWSATSSTPLVAYLRELGATTVLCCGLITSVCVQHTAYGIFDAGFKTILVADACADRGRARHEAALSLYGGYMYHVVTVADLTSILGPGAKVGVDGETRSPPMLTHSNYRALAKARSTAQSKARRRARSITLIALDVVVRVAWIALAGVAAFGVARRVARRYEWGFRVPTLVEALLDWSDAFLYSLSVGQ